MKNHKQFLVASAFAALVCCSDSGAYVYDPYYGYYPVVYDDAYYDAAMVSGYYYYPTAYYYELKPKAVASVAVVPPAVRLLLARWSATVDPGCISATSAGDNDRDGIDADSTVTFECNSSANDRVSTVTGAVNVRDLDDASPQGGYVLTFTNFAVRVSSAANVVTQRVVNGTETTQKTDTGIALLRDVTVDAIETFPDEVQRASRLQSKTQGTFVPEATPGSALVTRGTLTLTGEATFTGPDGLVFTLTRQTDPTVHWNNDCTRGTPNQGFDAGAIIYRSNQGRQTRIVYDSCTQVTATNSTVPAQ